MIILSTPSSFDTSIICFKAGIRTCKEITYYQCNIQRELKISSEYSKNTKDVVYRKQALSTFSICFTDGKAEPILHERCGDISKTVVRALSTSVKSVVFQSRENSTLNISSWT